MISKDISIAIIAGLGGMLGWGLADFFAKKTIDVVGSIKTLVWAHLFGTGFFVLLTGVKSLFFGTHVYAPVSVGAWSGLAFFGTLQMIVYWLVYLGFGKGQLAVLNPIFAAYSGVVALVSVSFLGEKVTPVLILALVVMFGGVILLNIDLKALKSKNLSVAPGFKEVALAALLASFWTIGWDKFVTGHDTFSYALYMYVFMSIAAVALTKLVREKKVTMPANLWKFVILIGLSEMVAYVAISWGYGTSSHTSTVALVSGSFSLPTLVLSHYYLKERVTRLQRAASLVIVAGIALVALS